MTVRWRCTLCRARGEASDYAEARDGMTRHYVDVHGPQAWQDYLAKTEVAGDVSAD